MKQDIHALAQRLKRVPAGTVQIISESGCVPRQAQTKGKGIIEPYAVFDGVMLEYNCFQGGSVRFTHRPLPHVLEINYCHQGRVGWDMKSGSTVYLGAGDLAMQPMDCCADSLMRFPSGWYMGHPDHGGLLRHLPKAQRHPGTKRHPDRRAAAALLLPPGILSGAQPADRQHLLGPLPPRFHLALPASDQDHGAVRLSG